MFKYLQNNPKHIVINLYSALIYCIYTPMLLILKILHTTFLQRKTKKTDN